MPIDLAGVSNENEFYTEHYLAVILDGDLRDTLSRWRRQAQEEGAGAPFEALRGLAGEFFRVHAAALRARAAEERLVLQREFLGRVLAALGYEPHAGWQPLEGGTLLPVLATLQRPNGAPELWAVEVLDSDQSDPLDASLQPRQFPVGEPAARDLLAESFDDIVTTRVFALSKPPRWLILASLGNLVLIDRSKWNEKRLLRFDLREIFDRKQTSTLEAMAALLHAENVQQPQAGAASLLDELDANSHRHAFSVSEDLKFALREAIELLGNEAVYDMRTRRKEPIYDRGLAEQLSRECLRYMYRLLFLFYIEARPELGYAPMKAEAYRRGCSLEWLRDLDLVRLDTPEAQDGYFIHHSIGKLFELVWDGYPVDRQRALDAALDVGFEIAPLKSHLFDPARIPLLSGLRFRNRVLRRIIELMSLSKERQGRRGRRGRVSYAQLGINQLGAVYEALLSFRGFFAEEDLFEVKRADSEWKELEPAFFVTEAELPLYTDEEKYFGGKLRSFSRGTFIYRLAGRDREKSASYYTPESLTRCLVKYALKELLKDKSAAEVLQLTICEPAMGSAAFLNEAVSQLADAYLDRKQRETGRRIAHEDYARERQKVKMRLADRNVFGVDLNPVALELAEVSLWLNCMFGVEGENSGAFIPWFGLQLVCGNSLIGARRDVWAPEWLTRRKGQPVWYEVPPTRVQPQARRLEGHVWHFLLPDPGMADWNGRTIRDLATADIARVKEWRKQFVSPSFEPQQIRAFQRLSAAIDRLWAAQANQLREMKGRTTDTLDVWGEPPSTAPVRTLSQTKDRIREAELLTRSLRASSPYRRLKLAMDYWCALWFWPIDKSELLPTRDEWLFELSALLDGQVYEVTPEQGSLPSLFPETRPEQLRMELEALGVVDVDALCARLPRLALVQEIASRHRFLHWELEFADIFEDRGGFDLTLGNPPWIKIEFDEVAVLGDSDPLLVVRDISASDAASRRAAILTRSGALTAIYDEYVGLTGIQAFLGASQNYVLMQGIQTNVYKAFLPTAWRNTKQDGIVGFLHPEGVFDDPKGGGLRAALYPRLRAHFQFSNEMQIFQTAHRSYFSINIYSSPSPIEFINLANLFLPSTIDGCFDHSVTARYLGLRQMMEIGIHVATLRG